MIKECLANGVFDTTPYIDRRPLIDYIPQDAIKHLKQQGKQVRQTVRYSPA